jgi:hypothetical protein
MVALLPPQFSELEPFVVKWAKPNFNERYAVRLSSSLDELKEFYSAVLPRAAEIKSYLDGKAFDAYLPPDKTLARLMFAISTVGSAVDIYNQPVVPDSGATSMRFLDEPEIT